MTKSRSCDRGTRPVGRLRRSTGPRLGRHTGPVPTRPKVSLWLTHPLNGLPLLLIGWVAWPFIVLSTDGLKDHSDLFLALGMFGMPLFALLWSWPEKLTLEDDALRISRPMRADQILPVSEITSIEAHYMPRVGPRVGISGRLNQQLDIPPGSLEAGVLLRRLGRRVEQLDMTRVIATERTRRLLGIPGGGRRDPWTPTQDHPPCPACGDPALEHPGSPVPAAVKGACAECVYYRKTSRHRARPALCTREFGSW